MTDSKAPTAPSMQIVAQLIDKKTGARSKTVTSTRREFADKLAEVFPPKKRKGAFVLILADDSVKKNDLDFSTAPLMTVQTFIDMFSQQNELPL